MYDVIIIGNGPAGVSAALYTKRSGFCTLIIGKDEGSLRKAGKIENYYGFPEPISGTVLLENGIKQATRLDVEFISTEATGIEYDGNFIVKTAGGIYNAKTLLIATGAARKAPKINGLSEFEGKGVSYCAVCDAFFHRGKEVAVLGCGAYAAEEAKTLLAVASSVTILSNGEPIEVDVPKGVLVDARKIKTLIGGDLLESIIFDDGKTMNTSGLFVAIGVAGSDEFARKLGVLTKNGKIIVDEKQATNLPGLYAAGDCTGGYLQIAKAVGDGAKAGLEMINYLRKNNEE